MTERDTRHTQHIHSHEEHSRLVRRPAGGGAPDTTTTGGVPQQTRHGLGKDERGQDQPTDKSRAQHDLASRRSVTRRSNRRLRASRLTESRNT